MAAGVIASADLIRLAYEGVLCKAAWGVMLALACRAFRAQDAYFARVPVNPPGPRLLLTHGVDPKVAEAYREVWVAPPKNPTLTPLYKTGFHGVLNPKDVVPESQLERTEFYDVCRRPRHVDAELGGGDVGGGGQIRFLTVNRAIGDPGFGEPEKRLMARIYPHLMQALELDAVLAAERSGAAWAGCAVDSLDDPVIRRDPDGRLRPLNAAGEAFLRSEGFGTWGGDQLLPRDPRTLPWQGAASCATGSAGVERSFRSGHTFRVFSSPCFEEDRFVGDVLRLRLVRRAPVASLPPGTPGFTPHESEVAALLCEGLSSPDICSRLGIGLNTLNTHIRHLFEKTGCHSRAQLVVRLTLTAREPEGEGQLADVRGYRD